MSIIKVEKLQKSFGELEVLKDVSFEVNKGDVIAVIGSSGSGKSPMLRCLIDLEKVTSGSISIGGEYLVKNGNYASQAKIRELTGRMGLVFQNFNLFPHLTVKQNLTLAPKLNLKLSKEELEERRDYYLS